MQLTGLPFRFFRIQARPDGPDRRPWSLGLLFQLANMGYRFAGFFIDRHDPELVDAIRSRWPFLEARPIYDPFSGFGFGFPDHEQFLSYEKAEPILEQRYAAEDNLPAFSVEWPDVTFLWVAADCFGGNCLYTGYACRSGAIVLRESISKDSLARLVRVFGVELASDQFFRPFTRGFFRR
jgi:hypothetical protein